MGKHVAIEDDISVKDLVDLAHDGEPVTITRAGQPVAEVKPMVEADPGLGAVEAAFVASLRQLRQGHPDVVARSIDLVRSLREDGA